MGVGVAAGVTMVAFETELEGAAGVLAGVEGLMTTGVAVGPTDQAVHCPLM